jgi:hypothetical protein
LAHQHSLFINFYVLLDAKIEDLFRHKGLEKITVLYGASNMKIGCILKLNLAFPAELKNPQLYEGY